MPTKMGGAMINRPVAGVGIAIFCVAGFLASGCGNGGVGSTDANYTVEMSKLAQMNGCLGCHRVDSTVVGPSWKVIAERYKDVPLAESRALLIDRVNKGSIGQYPTWKGGQGMPPMERRVSNEHIARLVDYILTLRPKPVGKAVSEPEPELEADQNP